MMSCSDQGRVQEGSLFGKTPICCKALVSVLDVKMKMKAIEMVWDGDGDGDGGEDGDGWNDGMRRMRRMRSWKIRNSTKNGK